MAQATPLNDWHRAHGGKMVDFAGWDMPLQYSRGILAEHLAVRKHGGLFDVSHMGRLRITGDERLAFLQRVLSNNCEALHPWRAQYTLVTLPSGGALDDAFLYRFGEGDYLLVVNAANKEADLAHFSRELERFPGATVEDVSHELAMIALQGPLTPEVLQQVVEAGPLPEPRQNCLSRVRMRGCEVLISRTGYTGEPNSFELFPPADKAQEVWQALLAAGQPLGLGPVGLGARDTLRLEAGMPLYGHELGLDPEGNEIPVFALGLAPVAVSFSRLKGDFIGRPALAAQLEAYRAIRDGVETPPPDLPRRIMCLALEDKGVPRSGYPVMLGERQVGVVTSGTSVPYWKFEGQGIASRIIDEHALRPLALAYVDSNLIQGQELAVQVRGRRLRARVVKEHGLSSAPPYFRPLPVGWEPPSREALEGRGRKKISLIISKALDNHAWRQEQCVNLIPSEQSASPLVRLLSITDPAHRYAEHRAVRAVLEREVYYYQGTGFIAWAEERLAAELAAYLGCDQVETRPISGQLANMTVFSALCAWKDRAFYKTRPTRIRLAMTNLIGNGGHLSAQPMGALRDFIAKDPVTERFAVINFPVRADNLYQMDLEETAKLLVRFDPELLVLGKSMVLHREPVAAIKAILDDLGKRPFIMYDMAHVLGLVGPHFQEPFKEGADFVTGSTHKTFFGPQRGVVGCDLTGDPSREELWEAVRRRAFPGMTSNHHLGTLLGLLAATVEMNTFKDQYQPQVLANAKALARGLKDAGLNVQGDPAIDYTETHQVVVEVGYAQGPEMAKRLEDNNLICNYQALPFDEGFSASSGLRLGVQEMTRFGCVESDMAELAGLLAEGILDNAPVKERAAAFRERFTDMTYCFQGEEMESLLAELAVAVGR